MNPLRPAVSAKPRIHPQRLKKPYPLPLRPLRPDRFIPPGGQKPVYLYVWLRIFSTLKHAACLPFQPPKYPVNTNRTR